MVLERFARKSLAPAYFRPEQRESLQGEYDIFHLEDANVESILRTLRGITEVSDTAFSLNDHILSLRSSDREVALKKGGENFFSAKSLSEARRNMTLQVIESVSGIQPVVLTLPDLLQTLQLYHDRHGGFPQGLHGEDVGVLTETKFGKERLLVRNFMGVKLGIEGKKPFEGKDNYGVIQVHVPR